MAGRDYRSNINLVGGARLVGQVDSLEVPFGDGVSVIPTGVWVMRRMAFAGKFTGAALLADASGGLVIDIWKATHANAPPTSGDSICASARPTLSSAQKSEDTSLTGWTVDFAAGDWLVFNVVSVSTVKMATLSLAYVRT
jgi:hypothetical protein